MCLFDKEREILKTPLRYWNPLQLLKNLRLYLVYIYDA